MGNLDVKPETATMIEREIARQDYENQSTEAQSRIQYQVDYSKTLLNALMLGNGGAIIGLLTFIGNTGARIDAVAMKWAFGWFSAGLTCVFLAYVGAFFSQFFFYNSAQCLAWEAQAKALGATRDQNAAAENRRGNIAMIAAIAAALFSLVAFIAGAAVAIDALT